MSNTNTISKTDQKIDALNTEKDISYVAAIFDTVDEAKDAYKQLKQIQFEEDMKIIDAAYIEKTERNRLRVHDHGEWILGEGILGGGVAGGLIGIIAGAILLPAAIGALVGGAIFAIYEENAKFSHKNLRDIADTLPIGTAAFVALVEDSYLEAVESKVQDLGGKKVHSNKVPKSTTSLLTTS